ncbi:MAG: zinc-dependent metalloprotease [Tannerella sp.]|jgi:hypothetical protein|nr:zinc-dependent metalloprotease [Tannerella sp.]
MKNNNIFLIVIIAFLCLGTANSQIVPSVNNKVAFSGNDKAVLDQRLSNYTVFTIDKREIISKLYNEGKGQFRICIDKQLDWTIELEFNDMRMPDYKQTYVTDKGEFEHEPFVVNTFKGKTSDNQIVRFTIDEDNFYGVILDEQEHYVIRPAKDYTNNKSDNSLIAYKKSDIIIDNNADYINDALEVPEIDGRKRLETNMMNNISTRATPCAYRLIIATDADYEFYQDMGSSVSNTYSYIFSILNIIEGLYQSTFGLRFAVSFQNVFTTSNQPYTSTHNSTLLNQLSTEWENNRAGIPRELAHLFTGKVVAGTGGLTWAGELHSMGNGRGYGFSVFRPEMYQTTAHEIGHTLGAYDNPNDCDCGKVNASVMCQGMKDANLWFCQQSKNEISQFLGWFGSYFQTGSVPTAITLSGTFNGSFQNNSATQTITTSQFVNNGLVSYKAGTYIEFQSGFEVSTNAAIYGNTENVSQCDDPE